MSRITKNLPFWNSICQRKKNWTLEKCNFGQKFHVAEYLTEIWHAVMISVKFSYYVQDFHCIFSTFNNFTAGLQYCYNIPPIVVPRRLSDPESFLILYQYINASVKFLVLLLFWSNLRFSSPFLHISVPHHTYYLRCVFIAISFLAHKYYSSQSRRLILLKIVEKIPSIVQIKIVHWKFQHFQNRNFFAIKTEKISHNWNSK